MEEVRSIIFVSHASPEDNQFSRWLTLQLSRRGYETWCDVTRLLGGENWWKDIDGAIRRFSCKFILVASQVSVKKGGVIRELKIAQEISPKFPNFIIPIKLDGVAYRDFPEGTGSELNAVDFSHGWAAGLNRLLKRLEEDDVPKSAKFNPEAVSDFWRKSFPAVEGINDGAEAHTSNWLPISSLPDDIWIHKSAGFASDGFRIEALAYPGEKHGEHLVTFLSPNELRPLISDAGIRIRSSDKVTLQEFLAKGSLPHSIRGAEAGNFVRSMLRKAWDANAKSMGFQVYELANGIVCFWRLKGSSKSDEFEFLGIDGKKQKRQLVGYKNYHVAPGEKPRQRFWHFAVQGRPILWPDQVFSIRTHVVFTEDGKTLIDSSARQHSARRSQCKSWWNDTWRDRMLAAVSALRDVKSGKIILQLSDSTCATLETSPQIFTAPITYSPVETVLLDDVPDVDDLDEDEVEAAETAPT